MAFKFLNREATIAEPGFNRWLVPPAALSIHLCIGQIYAYSVFNKRMTRILGIDASSSEDWDLTTLGWIFSIAIFTLGASAAIFGQWLERVGPRKAIFVSALCFAGGFFVGAFGVHLFEVWLVYLGHGVLGGIGYISPVSTLIKSSRESLEKLVFYNSRLISIKQISNSLNKLAVCTPKSSSNILVI